MKTYWVALVLGVGSAVCILISVWILVASLRDTQPIVFGVLPELDIVRHLDASSSGETADASHISINRASPLELELLPGVGPAIAKKIIDHRPYESLDDLMTKKVMGEKLFEKIKIFLAL